MRYKSREITKIKYIKFFRIVFEIKMIEIKICKNRISIKNNKNKNKKNMKIILIYINRA